MISFLRRIFVDSIAGRAVAIVLFLAFLGWGVGDVFSGFMNASPDVVAKVGDRRITAEQIGNAIRNQLPQSARQMGLSDPSQLPEPARMQVARQVLQQFLTENTVLVAASRAGMRVPDSLVRAEVFALPVFKGPNGSFDRALFNQRLAQIGMTEQTLLSQLREDLTTQGLLDGMGTAAHAPPGFAERMIAFNTRLHHVDVVKVAMGQMPKGAAPTDAQLHRYFDNHPWEFRSTEYRHAQIVVLTRDSVGRTIETPDDELRKLYDFRARSFHVPELRSLQVATMPSQARAEAIAAQWRGDVTWSAIEQAAHDGATVDFAQARQSDIPNPELASAAFQAPLNAVQGPVKSETGWLVFKVVAITPPKVTSFEEAKVGLRADIVQHEAPSLLNTRVPQFEDAVAGARTLDKIPSNLGAVPAAGTLDAQGNTQDGTPAPIPGDAALRDAIVARVFSQTVNAHPTVVHGPDNAVFAVYVDEVHPGAQLAFDAVQDKLRAAYEADAQRNAANQRAAALLAAARAGHLADTAEHGDSTGLVISRDLAISRMHPAASLPDAVTRQALVLQAGQGAMIEADDAFYVIGANGMSDASAAELAPLRAQITQSLDQSAQNDIPVAYVAGLQKTIPPNVNIKAFDAVTHDAGGTAQ